MVNLKFEDACEYEGRLWTLDSSGQLLCNINTSDLSLELISILNTSIPIHYRKVVLHEKRLFFVNTDKLGVYEYNLELQQGYLYEMNGMDKIIIMNAFIYKNEIIIVPYYFSNILYAFDTSTCKFHKIKCPLNSEKDEKVMIPAAHLYGNKIWFITDTGKKILTFNLKTNEVEEYLLPNHFLAGDIGKYKDEFLLLSIMGYCLCKWNPIDGIIGEYFFDESYELNDVYPRLAICENEIFLISVMRNGIYKFDKNDKKVKKIYTVKNDENSTAKALFIEFVKLRNSIVIMPWRADCLIAIDCKTGEIKEQKMYIEDFFLKLKLSEENGNLIYEDYSTTIEKMIEGVSIEKGGRKRVIKSNHGDRLYQALKRKDI